MACWTQLIWQVSFGMEDGFRLFSRLNLWVIRDKTPVSRIEQRSETKRSETVRVSEALDSQRASRTVEVTKANTAERLKYHNHSVSVNVSEKSEKATRESNEKASRQKHTKVPRRVYKATVRECWTELNCALRCVAELQQQTMLSSVER